MFTFYSSPQPLRKSNTERKGKLIVMDKDLFFISKLGFSKSAKKTLNVSSTDKNLQGILVVEISISKNFPRYLEMKQ
jgi:hypothetical protein